MYDGVPINMESNLNMQLKYFSMDDKELNPLKIVQGTDFYVEVSISHPGIKSDYENLALTQIFPSGWEIRNSRIDIVQAENNDILEYQDFRDDRVHTYFNLKKGKSKIFKVQLNASFVGRYYLPIAHCEAMYDNTISAKFGGFWVEVVRESVE